MAWLDGTEACIKDEATENSATTPATAHAARGRRVLTGIVPWIVSMVLFPSFSV